MWIHYDSMETANDHLVANGWRKMFSGAWISKDGTCRAHIHQAALGKVVVCYREIVRRAA